MTVSRRFPSEPIPSLILLDLDGTLTDSANGIIASMRHAFVQHGTEPPSQEVLRTFVGPPFGRALAELGYSPEQVASLVASYRADYNAGRLFDSEVYPGVESALAALHEARVSLAVATSKPQATARRIVGHFGLERYLVDGLASVFGADPERASDTKADVIGRALAGLGREARTDGVVMVGDRLHDVEGATAHGLPCVGVTWGYAQPKELEDAGAAAVARTPDELVALLLPT